MKQSILYFARLQSAVFGFFFIFSAVYAAELQSLDISEKGNTTKLSFTLSGSYTYQAFKLNNPSRVVIDFQQTKSRVDHSKATHGPDVIKVIRIGQPKQDTLRFVFDLAKPVTINAHQIGRKLTVELITSTQSTAVSKPTPIKSVNASLSTPVMVSRSPSKSLRDVVVVIDPGHGGKDPGAIGPKHHLEKNVVLAIALKLKAIIDKEPGMRAVLTRKGDYYVGLRERLEIARKHDGDIFISIHADAFNNRNSNGASVFALSPTGATSEAARWLAEKENYSELGGVNLSELDDQNGVIRSVLIDLSQTATIGASLKMGERVLRSIDNITNLHNEGVEQARFVVLKSPDIPSILVETGFISNPREESNLSSSPYQTRLSLAIFKGVKEYFFEYPPHGSHIEAMTGSNKHYVKGGETLSGIAAKYRTSISKLRELNHLKNDQLVVGQQLIISNQWS